ncbi:MAG: sulfite exporter TauE/SafE family protein [Proteobacteria bacterium]|nr:sulfite exporter TauE/SafE family protein [Pseudomonadota bacterium]MCL2308326.1 sulfite exporter TauE/SafE family protein [Pseudomonadota bacterium]
MELEVIIGLAGLIFLAAALYSSVGHGGASGYLAAMALFGLAPLVMKPTALTLNILVAAIATIKFYRAGCFSWKLFQSLALASVPFAFIGGAVSLPGYLYKPIVGLVLLYAAYQLLAGKGVKAEVSPPASRLPLFASGAVIGLLSGLTGVGGGIFLSPLLLFLGWAETRQVSGVAAAFILVNSAAGLLGHYSAVSSIPGEVLVWAPAAILGGWIGAQYGSRRLPAPIILKLLSAVLLVAGLKMLFGV